MADDSNFSTHVYSKFQTKGCTNCHDFFEKERGGLAFKDHKGRTPDMCVYCHTQAVTGFKNAMSVEERDREAGSESFTKIITWIILLDLAYVHKGHNKNLEPYVIN